MQKPKPRKYTVTYRERYKKVSPIHSVILQANLVEEAKEKFFNEIQEYSMFGEPKYRILKIRVMWGA